MKLKIKAFSLLEMALVIAIIGIVFSSITPIWHIFNKSNAEKLNEEKYNYIRLAMQNHLRKKGYLCAAAPDLNGISNENMIKGYVPYKTLGISKKYAFDANNKPFIFAVNKHFLNKNLANLALPITINIHHSNFCRILKPSNNGEMERYDEVCENAGLVVLENEESIILKDDFFYIMHDLKKTNSLIDVKIWLKNSLSTFEEKYKNCNTIAWVLIVSKKNNNKCSKINADFENKVCYISCSENGSGKENLFLDKVFYQTRFDMAAQIGSPCSSQPFLKE